jgi:hypothetical protein
MFTIDYESVNGGIYRSREQAATLPAARRLVRESMRGLSCYHLVFIADVTSGRRIQYGGRWHQGGWSFWPVPDKTREELETALVRAMGFEDGHHALAVTDEAGEFRFTRTDAYGPLQWRARRYEDGTYALDKIPG